MLNPIRAEEVEAKFPDSPQKYGKSSFDKLYSKILNSSEANQDQHTFVSYSLHYAASLAYVGDKPGAINLIEQLRSSPYSVGNKDVINAARRSPTYTPESEILLD